MTPEQATALRAPFPASAVGHLPKLTCKKCTESSTKVCDEHKKQRCSTCGNYLSTAHIDLEYVGHAATNDRLLQVDPEWTWKPMAVGPNGEPLVTNGGMWIELTVCGVTRPGFGDGKSPKEIIGDAIRNAAMRFGVALDLWTKEDLQAAAVESHPPSRNGDSAAGTPFSYDHDEPLDPPLEQVLSSGSAGEPTAVEAAASRQEAAPVPQAALTVEPASPADKTPSEVPKDPHPPTSEGAPNSDVFITKKQRDMLWAKSKKFGADRATREAALRPIIREHTGQESSAAITRDVFEAILKAIDVAAVTA